MRNRPTAAIVYRRTPAQSDDPVLAWRRADRPFFAAGACHVLAYRFVRRYPSYSMIHIAPTTSKRGHHMFASDGTSAFDFNGPSDHAALIEANRQACLIEDPTWDYELLTVSGDFDSYCKTHGHRAIAMFAGDVVARADQYLDELGV